MSNPGYSEPSPDRWAPAPPPTSPGPPPPRSSLPPLVGHGAPPPPAGAPGGIPFQVNNRTLMIGNQVYSLANVVRVMTYQLPKPVGDGQGNFALGCLGGIGVLIASAAILIPLGNAIAESIGAVASLVSIGGGLAVGATIYNKTKRHYPPSFALVLDTSGLTRTVLASTNFDLIVRMQQYVSEAIENRMEGGISINLDQREIITGDKIEQYGEKNVGKYIGK